MTNDRSDRDHRCEQGDLRGCHSSRCTRPATHVVFWPGRRPVLFCDEHREAALRVADALGCYVHVHPIPEET